MAFVEWQAVVEPLHFQVSQDVGVSHGSRRQGGQPPARLVDVVGYRHRPRPRMTLLFTTYSSIGVQATRR